MTKQPDFTDPQQHIKEKVWRYWIPEVFIYPWIASAIEYWHQSQGRDDIFEICGMVLFPAFYIVIGMFIISIRRERLAERDLASKLKPALANYSAVATIALIALAVFQAAMVMFISELLFRSGLSLPLIYFISCSYLIFIIADAFARKSLCGIETTLSQSA